MTKTFLHTSRWYWGTGILNLDGRSYYWQMRFTKANYAMPDLSNHKLQHQQRREADGTWTHVFSGKQALGPWGSLGIQLPGGVDVPGRALQDGPEFFCVRA